MYFILFSMKIWFSYILSPLLWNTKLLARKENEVTWSAITLAHG